MDGGGSSGSGTQVVKNETIPEWLREPTQGVVSRAQAVSEEPYQAYTGQRVADVAAPTQQAYQLTEKNVGAYKPYLSSGSSMVSSAGQGFNPNALQTYYNPYQQSVMDVMAKQGQRNLVENLLPEVNTTFTGAGMFGGSRHADFTGNALRDVNESIMNQQAQLAQQGYNTALGAYQADLDRRLKAGESLANLGEQAQTMGLKDASALQSIGAAQQAQEQKNLDTAYNDFLVQRDYPKTQVQFLSDIIRGIPSSTFATEKTTTSSPNTNTLASILGTALGGYNAYQGLSNYKDGGKVKKKAKKV